MSEPLLQIDLPGIPKIRSGKVRELFDLGDTSLMVAIQNPLALGLVRLEKTRRLLQTK